MNIIKHHPLYIELGWFFAKEKINHFTDWFSYLSVQLSSNRFVIGANHIQVTNFVLLLEIL